MADAEQRAELPLERLALGTEDEALAVAHTRDGGQDVFTERSELGFEI